MNQNWIKEIQMRVKKVPVSSGRSNKVGKVNFDDLVFIPLNKGHLRALNSKIAQITKIKLCSE